MLVNLSRFFPAIAPIFAAGELHARELSASNSSADLGGAFTAAPVEQVEVVVVHQVRRVEDLVGRLPAYYKFDGIFFRKPRRGSCRATTSII